MYRKSIAHSASSTLTVQEGMERFQGMVCIYEIVWLIGLTLLELGLIKINDVSANFNNPRPSFILNK